MANRNSNASAQPPTVELVSQHGQRQSFTQSSIVIGRDASCDLVVNDSHVSGHHARITWDGSHFILEDLGSTNGTYVSGERLSGPRVLRDVCLIGIGSNVRLGFQVGAPAVGGRPSVSPETQSIGGGIAPAAAAPQRVRRRRSRLLIPGAILLALACILALVAAVGYRQLRAEPVTGPIVLIRSPEHGAELTVGQAVTIHAVARGDEKVTRLELWIDGELYEVQRSALAGGSSPLPLVAQWDPASMGNHTLTARAFDTQDARGQASVTVEAVDRGDGDGDGVADAVDACPDAPGSAAAAGCPDQDRDGIRDGEDACPDEAGLPESDGCPMPGDGDRDGDGLLDVADACPDEAGSPRVEGCPDADADGVPDDADACPEEPGWPEYDGCRGPSDRDGDGLPD
jgi:hypothetical protein